MGHLGVMRGLWGCRGSGESGGVLGASGGSGIHGRARGVWGHHQWGAGGAEVGGWGPRVDLRVGGGGFGGSWGCPPLLTSFSPQMWLTVAAAAGLAAGPSTETTPLGRIWHTGGAGGGWDLPLHHHPPFHHQPPPCTISPSLAPAHPPSPPQTQLSCAHACARPHVLLTVLHNPVRGFTRHVHTCARAHMSCMCS